MSITSMLMAPTFSSSSSFATTWKWKKITLLIKSELSRSSWWTNQAQAPTLYGGVTYNLLICVEVWKPCLLSIYFSSHFEPGLNLSLGLVFGLTSRFQGPHIASYHWWLNLSWGEMLLVKKTQVHGAAREWVAQKLADIDHHLFQQDMVFRKHTLHAVEPSHLPFLHFPFHQ